MRFTITLPVLLGLCLSQSHCASGPLPAADGNLDDQPAGAKPAGTSVPANPLRVEVVPAPQSAPAAPIAAVASVATVETPPLLLEGIASFGATRCGGWLYVYSGHRGTTHEHSIDNLSASFSRLNLVDQRTWEALPCPLPLQSSALVTWRDQVIRVGGMNARNRSGESEDLHSTATAARFDTVSRTWTPLPDLPEPRSSHNAAVVGDRLFVIGGWTLDGKSEHWLGTAWTLDLAAPGARWETLPAPPFSTRRAVGIAAAGTKVIVVGGMTEDASPTSEVHVFDTGSQSWSRGPDLPFSGFAAAAAGVGDAVYASGLRSRVFRLDTASQPLGWTDAGGLALPRFFHQFVPAGDGRLFAVGGATPGGHARSIETFDPAPAGPRISKWTLPFPGAAKNRQAVFLHGDALWLFGGNNSLGQHDFGADNFLDEGWRIDLGTMRFERLAPFPARRQSMQTIMLPGARAQAMAVGGFGTREGSGTRSWPETFLFDFEKRTWTPSAPLPAPRTQFDLVERDGRVLVFGGLDYDSKRGSADAFRLPLDVAAFGTDGRAGAAGITIPQARRAFGGATLGGRYYMVGGMKGEFEPVLDADVYDFASRTWSKAPAPSKPRISPLLASLGGKLYLAGGGGPGAGGEVTPDRSVEVFDPATGAWTTLIGELPVQAKHLRMFAWRDRLIFWSVYTDGEPAATLLVVRP